MGNTFWWLLPLWLSPVVGASPGGHGTFVHYPCAGGRVARSFRRDPLGSVLSWPRPRGVTYATLAFPPPAFPPRRTDYGRICSRQRERPSAVSRPATPPDLVGIAAAD